MFFVLDVQRIRTLPRILAAYSSFSQPSSSHGCAGLVGMRAEEKCVLIFLQKAIMIDAQRQKAILARIISAIHTRLTSVL
jgi:hypothetical protein